MSSIVAGLNAFCTLWRQPGVFPLGSRVDTAAKTVSTTLDHLSSFALLGESSTGAVYLPLVIKSYGGGW